MARVTVEDCVLKVPNRFELVMLAAQRARNISAGVPLTVDRDNDKNPVVALREIADRTVDLEELESGLIKGLQHFVERDEPIEEEMDLQAIQGEIAEEAGEARTDEEIAADMLSVGDDANPVGDASPESMGLASNAFSDVPEDVPETPAPEDVLEDVPENAPEVPAPEDVLEDVPENAPEAPAPEDVLEDVPENAPEAPAPENVPEG